MATEVYRIEIPILVDDKSEEPIERARARVSKLEQEALRRNQLIRKHFETFAKMKIEPVMRIRDRLTAGVLKADRLLKMLNAEQAAPVLVAQDKVSAVVLRINQLLDAMEKNKVHVLADLKGPLVQEIAEARAALVALSKVQAAPVAELRGRLYAQLTRAMAVVRQLDRMRVEPWIELRERVLAKAREIGAVLRGLTSRAWKVTIEATDRVGGFVTRLLGMLSTPLGLLGAGAGTYGLVGFPLKLAGEMEQAFIGMEFFLKSREKASEFMDQLFKFAAETPFELPQLREMAVQLLGANFAADQTLRILRAFGDAASMTGAGINGMKLALLGFRQIATIGTLQMEELRQVTENLLIPMEPILYELGLTRDALKDLGKQGIDSARAMEAIVRVLERDYAGGMAKQARSFFGLLSTIKDYFNIKFVFSWGEGLREVLVPQLQKLVDWLEAGGNKAKEVERGFAGWASADDPIRRVNRAIEEGVVGWAKLVDKSAYTVNRLEQLQGQLRLLGRETAQFVVQKLQDIAVWLERITSGEQFQKADLGGKLAILFDETVKAVAPKIAEAGVEIGLAFGKGIISGLAEVIEKDPILRAGLTALVAGKVPGPPWAKALIFAGGYAGVTGYFDIKEHYDRIKSEIPKGYITRPAPFSLPEAGAGAGAPPVGMGHFRMLDRYQHGGIVTGPRLAVVGEAGPEAIIPLSARMRQRALALWERAGKVLGVRFCAEGGFVGTPVPALAGAGAGAPPVVSLNMHFDLAGLVRQVVINNAADIDASIDHIAGVIADSLRGIFQNMPRSR